MYQWDVHSMVKWYLFFQDTSLLVHSPENVSLNARNENGDVTGRISVGKSLTEDTCTHRHTHIAPRITKDPTDV